MPIGRGKQRVEYNVPQGFRERLRALRQRLAATYRDQLGPAATEDAMMLDWLVSRAEEWAAWREQAAEDARQAVAEREAAAAEAERMRAEVDELRRQAAELPSLSQRAREIIEQAARQGMSPDALVGLLERAAARPSLSPQAQALVDKAVERGLRPETFVAILEVFLASRAAIPEQVAGALRELGGLEAARQEYGRRIAALQASIADLRKVEAQAKRAAEAAVAEAQQVIREGQELGRRMARVRAGVDEAEVTATLLDLRLRWLTDRLRHLTDYPTHGTGRLPQTVRTLLAGLLLVPMPQEDDLIATIPAAPGHPLPHRVPISLIAAALAPRQAIAEQEQLWLDLAGAQDGAGAPVNDGLVLDGTHLAGGTEPAAADVVTGRAAGGR